MIFVYRGSYFTLVKVNIIQCNRCLIVSFLSETISFDQNWCDFWKKITMMPGIETKKCIWTIFQIAPGNRKISRAILHQNKSFGIIWVHWSIFCIQVQVYCNALILSWDDLETYKLLLFEGILWTLSFPLDFEGKIH